MSKHPASSSPASASSSPATGLRPGMSGYRGAVVALVAAGLASFNAMYATQGLLPALTEQLHVSPSAAALTVSAVTGMLALSIIPASVTSERFGRGRVLIVCSLGATALGIALAFAPSFGLLVAGRALQGLLVAGVPAVAMAWIAEEMHSDWLAPTMGLYVAGTTVGGLLGRLVPGSVAEVASWHWAMFATAALAFACAIVSTVALPAQRNFHHKHLTLRGEYSALTGHLRNPRIAGLFAVGFLLMGSFVSVYNYLGFRLRADYGFSDAAIGVVFLLYLVGTVASAGAGKLAARIGRSRVVMAGIAMLAAGLLITLLSPIWSLLVGVAVVTGGLFTAHATASGWVSALATTHRAEASAMYLCCYYLGSSAIGYLTGFSFHAADWPGLVATLLTLVALAALVTWTVVCRPDRRLPP